VTRFGNHLNGVDFRLHNGLRCFARANDDNNPWRRQNRSSLVGIEAAEDVTRKKRQIQLLGSVRRLSPRLIKGRERAVSLTL
jgi:hypothetical protein